MKSFCVVTLSLFSFISAELTHFERGLNFYDQRAEKSIGLKADPSVAGQLGYHLDFLKVAKDLNGRFNRNFIDQYNLLKSV